MKHRCTLIGAFIGMAAVFAGIAADICCCNSHCQATQLTNQLRRKASHAMHMLGDKIDKAADTISD